MYLTVPRAIIAEKLSEYMQYKHTYTNAPAKQDTPDFQDRIPPEIALELCVVLPDRIFVRYLFLSARLVAADYYESGS